MCTALEKDQFIFIIENSCEKENTDVTFPEKDTIIPIACEYMKVTKEFDLIQERRLLNIYLNKF